MKTLVICRHAKSDWSNDLPDIDRPLNDRGHSDAPMMGKVLAKNGFNPDLIVSSPANRARTTAAYVAKALGYGGKIQEESGIYHQGESFVQQLVMALPDSADTVMLFGHNPTLEYVAKALLGAKGNITLPTGSMICLDNWANNWGKALPGTFSLRWHLIPKILKQSIR